MIYITYRFYKRPAALELWVLPPRCKGAKQPGNAQGWRFLGVRTSDIRMLIFCVHIQVPLVTCSSSTHTTGEDMLGSYTKRSSTCTVGTDDGDGVRSGDVIAKANTAASPKKIVLSVREYSGGNAVVFSTKLLGVVVPAPVVSAGGWKSKTLAPIIGWPSFPIDSRTSSSSSSRLDAAQWLVWNRGQLGDTVGSSNVSGAFEQLGHVPSPLVLVDDTQRLVTRLHTCLCCCPVHRSRPESARKHRPDTSPHPSGRGGRSGRTAGAKHPSNE